MKRMILFLIVFSAVLSYGQNKNTSDVTFYGIDFTLCKTYGAAESGERFKSTFKQINQLFYTEANKYNVDKYLDVNVKATSLDAVDQVNSTINASEIPTKDKKYELSNEMIQEALNKLPIETAEGVGLVFMAEMLSKSKGTGFYKIVFFDQKTKQIIEVIPSKGKAGGAGLRNFWANSVREMMKKA